MSSLADLFDRLDLPWAEFDEHHRLVRRHPAFPRPEDLPALTTWQKQEDAAHLPPTGRILAGPRGHDLTLWPRAEGGYWAVLHPRPAVRTLTETWIEEKPFLNMLVHELRLPVTVIKGYTSLMDKGLAGPLTEKQKEFLQTMSANVARLERLLELVGLLSKVAHRRLPYEYRPITLGALVEEPLRRWQEPLATKGIALEHLPPGQAQWQVRTDPQYARWIVGHLLENAWAYTPSGGQVWLLARHTPATVDLEIHDTGFGISRAEQERLFTPFFRSPDERVREHPGWGLALHVARLLARELGGDLTYRPGEDQGSVFILRLPAATSPSSS